MKSLLILLGLLAFINAQANTYFTDDNNEEGGDCVNEVIEYTVESSTDYMWSAICDEDEVTDDCEFWAFEFVYADSEVAMVWAGESTANTDTCAATAEAGTDDLEGGNCVQDEDNPLIVTCTYEVDSSEGSGYGYYFYLDELTYNTRRNLVVLHDTARSDITADDWGTSEECVESDFSIKTIAVQALLGASLF